MEWRCAACDRLYDDPPETCVCGSSNLQPRTDDGSGRYSLRALRKRLVEPADADRSLVRDEPYVTGAFQVLAVLAAVLGLLLLAVLFL